MNVIVRVVARYAPIVTIPVAVVLGFIGYTFESTFMSRKTDYLEKSISEEREERLLSTASTMQRDDVAVHKRDTIFGKNDPTELSKAK